MCQPWVIKSEDKVARLLRSSIIGLTFVVPNKGTLGKPQFAETDEMTS